MINKYWWQPGIIIFLRISASTAIPIILALIIGTYLDERYGTSPRIFITLIIIAFIVSLVSIWRNIIGYIEKLKKEEDEKESREDVKIHNNNGNNPT